MQGDFRQAHGVRGAHAARPALDYNRSIPKVERPVLRLRTDMAAEHKLEPVASPAVTPVAHPKAPEATSYHVVIKPEPVEVAVRTEHKDSNRQWLKKMRRRSLIKRIKHSLKGSGMIYAAASFVFVLGGVVTVQGFIANSQVKEQAQVLSAKADSEAPDSSEAQSGNSVPSETKPKSNYLETYKVAADLPRILTIPSIGEKARILQVGVDSNNQVLTPKSIYDTAWYTGSAKPGETGAALIDGHFVGPTTSGVFSRLNQLKPGQEILVERGDGKKFSFAVSSVETVAVDKVDMGELLVSKDVSKPGLTLITCGGKYNAKTFEFADRTIVRAVLGEAR